MTTERRYSEYDMKIAERIAGLETTVHETVIPLLRDIASSCRERCGAPPFAAVAPSSPPPDSGVSSSAWFWGKVAGAVVAVLSTITAVGVALVQKAPEILAAVSAFFNPPKHP